MKQTYDLGIFDERDLIAKWLPNGHQPKLPPLEIQEKEDGVHLLNKRADVSIVWKNPKDSIWNMYTEPIPSKMTFEAKAERIGYLDSEILYFEE
ncbi:hypothetical protein ACOCEA_07310 [Maribacter sp. CXY002]|uniref:hypothetical protein n=1 Tax=Maribacter luteocoastalis TaxID=3407671 RepID=UPI003B683961